MSKLSDFIAAADRDNRVGDVEVQFLKLDTKVWDNGDKTIRAVFSIPSAGGAKADCTLPERFPTDAEIDAWKATLAANVLQAKGKEIGRLEQLKKHYSIERPDQLMEGSTLSAKTVKTKVDADGKGGFIRIIAFLPKGSVKSAGAFATTTPDGQAIPNF